MKLSDIKGERTLEVIAEIIDPICNIGQDKEASAVFRRERLPKGSTAKDFLVQKIRKSVPVLLKKHKKDLIVILAALEGVSPKKYTESLNAVKLITDWVELLTDEVFVSLFISAPPRSGAADSGSARENTEGT